MPPIKACGHNFLLGPDDVSILIFPDLFCTALCLLVDTARAVRIGWLSHIGVDAFWIDADAVVCAAVIVLDVVSGCFSASCSIKTYFQQKLVAQRVTVVVTWLLVMNFILKLVALGIYSVVTYHWLTYKHESDHHEDVAREIAQYEAVASNTVVGFGWGPDLAQSWWTLLFAKVLIILRLLCSVAACIIVCVAFLPKNTQAKIWLKITMVGFRWMKVHTQLSELCFQVLLKVEQGVLDKATPIDIVFGLLLVRWRQLGKFRVCAGDSRGTANSDTDGTANSDADEYDQVKRPLSEATALSSTVKGYQQPPVPFDLNSDKDQEILYALTYYSTFAFGMYGPALEIFNKSVYEYSSWISSCRATSNFCRACPCVQEDAAKIVDGDLCCRLNEYALRRTIADTAEYFHTEEAELIWATWENGGAGTSPPLAVILDHANRKVVIAVRGTMDLKDAIADLGAEPSFFDPLGRAGPNPRKEKPFDEDADYYVHSAILECAEDALSRIRQRLQAALAPGGPADGWDIICVGHSLGAGVACLLALQLQVDSDIPANSNVEYIGFEPPGGLLSKQLSKITGELGFISVVCANDWISRLSIRNVQRLRNSVMEELRSCDRTKLQLVLLSIGKFFRTARCLRCCMSAVGRCFIGLAGGFLDYPRQEERGFEMEEFPKLWPPSRVVYIRPIEEEHWACGFYQVSKAWTAEWIQPEDLNEIIVTMRSIELHFPNILQYAYASAAKRLGAIVTDEGSSDENDCHERLV